MHVCVCIHMYVYVCIYICPYIYIYIYIYVHTYIHMYIIVAQIDLLSCLFLHLVSYRGRRCGYEFLYFCVCITGMFILTISFCRRVTVDEMGIHLHSVRRSMPVMISYCRAQGLKRHGSARSTIRGRYCKAFSSTSFCITPVWMHRKLL